MRGQKWVWAVVARVALPLGAASLAGCTDEQLANMKKGLEMMEESSASLRSPKKRKSYPDSSRDYPDAPDSGASHVVVRGGLAYPESGYAWVSNGSYEGRDPSSGDLRVMKEDDSGDSSRPVDDPSRGLPGGRVRRVMPQ